jgi:hypothetical protein
VLDIEIVGLMSDEKSVEVGCFWKTDAQKIDWGPGREVSRYCDSKE